MSKPTCEFCVGGEGAYGGLVAFAIDGILLWERRGNGAFHDEASLLIVERCDMCCKYSTDEEAFAKVVSILRNHKEN